MDEGELAIFAVAVVLAFVPALVDRWAVHRDVSPKTLITLATVTLVGIAAVPVAFAICTGVLAAHDGSHDVPSIAAVAGLLLVAIAAGRTLARVFAIRRRWGTLSRVAAALELPAEPGGARVLPVDELLAFASGTEAFISQGLIDRLSPAQLRAVIEHEREHARQGHTRLLAAARALTHGSFEIAPARHAVQALDRELDVLADTAATRRLGGPIAIEDALRAVAVETGEDTTTLDDAATQRRIAHLTAREMHRRSLVDNTVRLITLAIGVSVLVAICLSVHTSTVWLGVAVCALLLASFAWFTKPVLGHDSPVLSNGDF